MSMFIPSSLEEIQNWVFSRIKKKKAFRICGKGSRFVNSVSGESDFFSSDIISLQKFNSNRFFDPEDMVVSLESGMSICKMQQMLAKKNMFLPVNPWFPDSCIGSVVACNDFGPNRMNMGGLRDFIIGIEYINGKGEIVRAGGKVVKNVSGYDLSRMLLGSQGGLGVITAVTFKVLPQPTKPCGMFGIFENQDWLQKVKHLHECKIPLDWVQASSTFDKNWILGLGFSGNDPTRKRFEKEINIIFKNSMIVLSDGENYKKQEFTPGQKRFVGFLPSILETWGMDKFYFHVFATLPTEKMLSFPIDIFLKENFKIIIHPIGGDMHIIHKSTVYEEQLKFLGKIKSLLIPDGKLRWVSSSPKSSMEDLGRLGVANGYSLTKRLKRHLDPAQVFLSAYYNIDLDK